MSSVGAMFDPGAIGASTLAAMAVHQGDLVRVADAVSARREVDHNCERDHRYNLWFVANAHDADGLGAALAAIARDTGCTPLSLPLVTDYSIDLGFGAALEPGHPVTAMCVWDVPDDMVDRFGATIARETGVTLCHRRERAPPEWPYNLYCMVHGSDRAQVRLHVAEMAAWHTLDRYPCALLFTKRRFRRRHPR